jgi:signal transduction histidine kinase
MEIIGTAAWLLLPVVLGRAAWLRLAYLRAAHARAEHAEKTKEEEARHRVADERMRIARDLHDVIAHHLLKTTVGLLRQAGDSDSPLEPAPGLAQLPGLGVSADEVGDGAGLGVGEGC